jgi:RNA-directed DNA polymerase
LLANLYLHWFDKSFHRSDGPAHWAKAKLVRYADDFVILARYQGPQLVTWIESLLEDRFRLAINRDKTKIVNVNQPGASLDFLGYTFRYERDLFGRPWRYLNVFPSKKALARARAQVHELTGQDRNWLRIESVISQVNVWLRSWARYLNHRNSRREFRKLNWFAYRRLKHHVNRRSQRRLRIPEGKSLYAHLHTLGWQQL